MSQSTQFLGQDVEGIGEKTAEGLSEYFDRVEEVIDAAVSIPDWLLRSVDGVGPKTLETLQECAGENGKFEEFPEVTRMRAQEGTVWDLYEKRYYPVGFTSEGLGLWYSGYYQGGSYGTAISRQVWSRDKVNSVMWGYFQPRTGEWDPIKNHKYGVNAARSPVSHPSGEGYLADIIDDRDWSYLTEDGLIFYQRNRNYRLSDYPTSLDGHDVLIGGTLDPTEADISGSLLGVTLDRIAIYWQSEYGRRAVPVVKRPDGSFQKLRQRSEMRFATNSSGILSGYHSPEAVVTDLANGDRPGMSGSKKGRDEGGLWKWVRDDGVQVRDKYTDLV